MHLIKYVENRHGQTEVHLACSYIQVSSVHGVVKPLAIFDKQQHVCEAVET